MLKHRRRANPQSNTRVRVRRIIAASVMVFVVVGTVETITPAAVAAPVPADRLPQPDNVDPVPGAPWKAAEQKALPTPQVAATTSKSVAESTPDAGAFTLTLDRPGVGVAKVAKIGAVGAWKQVGLTGIFLALRQTSGGTPSGAKPSQGVSVQLLSAEEASAAGVSGLALKVTSEEGSSVPIAVKVAPETLSAMYGADYGARVTWRQYAINPDGTIAAATGVPSSANGSAVTASAVTATVQPTLVVAASGPVSSKGTGNFGATNLIQSGEYKTETQTGSFTYAYPLPTPPSAEGAGPALALTYDSGMVDGQTGSTNNQPSMVGEGWNLSGSGFIERRYISCSQDTTGGSPATGDLCWKSDNATIQFGSHSGALVKDTVTGQWRLQSDDGTKIERMTSGPNGDNDGEYWVLTTTDGTKYYFGSKATATAGSTWTVPVYGNQSGEPCHGATFATSSCTQAWRWNLDYVVDTNDNAQTYHYTTQTNKYASNLTNTNATPYIRGGQLARVEYGLRPGISQAPYRVVFDSANRCVAAAADCVSSKPTNWPDVPWDQNCAAAPCTSKYTPTFWTTTRLAAVRTQYLISGTTYQEVDKWALVHTFPAPGDTTTAALWLSTVTHTGMIGTPVALPPVKFTPLGMQNRVWAVDGLAPMVKFRISTVTTETGAGINVVYSAKQCSSTNLPANPQTNTMRCFPQWWTPDVGAAKLDYFHTYVVTQVAANPVSGTNPIVSSYDYIGTPAYKYTDSVFIPEAKRTWSDYAGYSKVRVRTGDAGTPSQQQTTEYTFFQGLDGDRATPSGGTKSVSVTASDGSTVTDSAWWGGQTREERVFNGNGGSLISKTITTPYGSPATASDGTLSSRYIGVAAAESWEVLNAGGDLNTKATATYDANGRVIKVNDLGNTADASDDLCTTTTYADNPALNLMDLTETETTLSAACTATAVLPADAVTATRNYYDGAATLSAAPTRGNQTKNQVVKSYSGSTANWMTTATTTYDALGRPTAVVDAKNRSTTTAYTPSGGGVATSKVTTNVKGWTTTTTLAPAWGTVTSETDVAGRKTEATYDALGRRAGVWNPDRPKASNPIPSVGFTYTFSTAAVATVTIKTNTVVATGAVKSTYLILDGLLRPRQTQEPSAGGGRIITDTFYNGAGDISATNSAYYTTGTPGGVLFAPGSVVPQQIQTTYDGAARPTAEKTIVNNAELWRTTYAYDANSKTTVPPSGGTPTMSITDARDNTIQLRQYTSATASGAYDATNYSYDANQNLTNITDTAGNTWSWTYDLFGNVLQKTEPDTGTTTSTYEPETSMVLTTTDARNITLAYTYDNLDRRTGRFLGTTSGTQLAGWTYDTLANGEVTTSTRYDNGNAYTTAITGYTAAGQPTGQTTTIPTGPLAGSYTTGYTYGPDGSKLSQSNPAVGGLPAETVYWGYSDLGQQTALDGVSGGAGGSTNYAGGTVRTHLNELTQFSQSKSGAFLNRTYYYADGTRRLQRSLVTNSTTTAADRNYTYSDGGTITAVKDTATGVVDNQCFTYDYVQRLTQAWTPASGQCADAPTQAALGGPAPYWQSYTYDAVGNRTELVHHSTAVPESTITNTYAYPAPGQAKAHAVSAITATSSGGTTPPPPSTDTYGYDAAGNLTTSTVNGQSLTATYDAEGNATAISVGSATQTNIYDVDGNLLVRTDSVSGTTVYLEDTELNCNTAGQTFAVRSYTIFSDVVATRTNQPGSTTSTVTWQDTDPVATATIEQPSGTSQLTRRYFDPFGATRDTAPVPWTNNHGYLDKPTSETTGYTTLGARDYAPAIGKFVTPDPIIDPTDPQQLNPFAYANNSPISKSDPTGMLWDWLEKTLKVVKQVAHVCAFLPGNIGAACTIVELASSCALASSLQGCLEAAGTAAAGYFLGKAGQKLITKVKGSTYNIKQHQAKTTYRLPKHRDGAIIPRKGKLPPHKRETDPSQRLTLKYGVPAVIGVNVAAGKAVDAVNTSSNPFNWPETGPFIGPVFKPKTPKQKSGRYQWYAE